MTENDASSTAPPEHRRRREGRFPTWLPTTLIGIATVLAIVSSLTTWVRSQALDTDGWVRLSEELLDEPEVRNALSVYLVDELYRLVDVRAEIEDQLPDNLAGLAGPVSAALREPATRGVERLLGTEEVRAVWSTVNRAAHSTLVRILRDETRPGLSTAGGEVTLELTELVRQVGTSLGLSESILDRIPDDAGRITIFKSDELRRAQNAVQVLDFLSWFLFLVVVGLYALGVYLAPERRLEMFRNVGVMLILAGAVLLVARVVAIRSVIDSVVADPSNRPVAQVASYVATGMLRQTSWTGITYGLLFVAYSAFLGNKRWAVSTRRLAAPLFNASPAAVASGTAVLLLVVLWWSPGRAFERWVTGLVLIALLIGGVIALRRRTLEEFPDVGFDTSLAIVKGALSSARAAIERIPMPGPSRGDSLADQLEAVGALHVRGELSDAEYAAAKERILAAGPAAG